MTTHGSIDPEYREQMQKLAKLVDTYWNGPKQGHQREVGFILLVFPFGQGDRINYISNAERRDVVVALKELVARFEGQDHEAPGGKH